MIQVYAMAVIAALAFFSGWKVSDWRNDAQKVAVQEAIDKAKAAFSEENAALGQKLEDRLKNLRVVNKTINNEVQREIHEKPVYMDADCALPLSGVGLLRAARGQSAGSPTGKSDSTVPATPPTGGKADAAGRVIAGGNRR